MIRYILLRTIFCVIKYICNTAFLERLLNNTDHINVQLPIPSVNCKNVLTNSYKYRRSSESCLYVADC